MMKIVDFLHNTKIQAFLALVIVIGGGLAIIFGGLDATDKNRTFDVMFLTVTFYFGSSKSGKDKDDTIAKMATTQSNPVATTDSGDINLKK